MMMMMCVCVCVCVFVGLRMVKLGLYDPGFEEEIAFYTFDEIYSWGASDLQTFEFRVASERMLYSFKTMHAQNIEKKSEKSSSCHV